MRLQDGTYTSNGRVELCLNGVWGSICNKSWDHVDAGVICKQLGYDSEGNNVHSMCEFYHDTKVNSFPFSTKMLKSQVCLDLEGLC